MKRSLSDSFPAANLFVVDTPLQLLNTVEAQRHFGVNNSVTVILLWAFNRSSFDRILPMLEGNIVYFDVPFVSPLWNSVGEHVEIIRTVIQLIRRKKFDRFFSREFLPHTVFVGSYWSEHMRHVDNVLRTDELVSLDDGTDTLLVYEKRASAPAANVMIPVKTGLLQRLRSSFRKRHVDWLSEERDSVIFFSMFDDADVCPRDIVIPNEYRFLKGKFTNSKMSCEVIFLGQSLVTDGYLDLIGYVRIMNEVQETRAFAPMDYVPHPRETSECIEAISKITGITLRRVAAPIEIELTTSGSQPAEIASFFCTALETCSAIFTERTQITSYLLPMSKLSGPYQSVMTMYQYFKTHRAGRIRFIALDHP